MIRFCGIWEKELQALQPNALMWRFLCLEYRQEVKERSVGMSGFLYFIAILLIIGWIVGLTAFDAGGLIHILLVLAIIAVLFRLIRGRSI